MRKAKVTQEVKKEVDTLEERIVRHILDDNDKRPISKFCQDEGISTTRYTSIKGDPRFQSVLSNIADDLLKGSILEVTKSFVKEAIKGNAVQQRMYFEMLDKYSQKIEIRTANEEVKAMSTEDLVKIVSAEE